MFDKILQNEIRLGLGDVLDLSPQLQKLFSQRYKRAKELQRNVDTVRVDSIEVIDTEAKNYYLASTPKVPIRMDSGTRYTALLDTGAEINVMTEEMMIKEGLPMRPRPHLNLVGHTGHSKNFLGVCEDVAISIGGFTTRHHIFVVSGADHMLVLGQPFMIKVRASTEWREDGMYMTTHDATTGRQAVFRINSGSDVFSLRGENEIFPVVQKKSLN